MRGEKKVLILDTPCTTGVVPGGRASFKSPRSLLKGRYLNGFRMLTLGWSDGASFVPVDHAVLSSRKQKNRIQGITKEMDRRTCGAATAQRGADQID